MRNWGQSFFFLLQKDWDENDKYKKFNSKLFFYKTEILSGTDRNIWMFKGKNRPCSIICIVKLRKCIFRYNSLFLLFLNIYKRKLILDFTFQLNLLIQSAFGVSIHFTMVFCIWYKLYGNKLVIDINPFFFSI